MNILLIEDEAKVADFIRRGLKSEGWSVEHTFDGETGLELLKGRDFDVVVLDLMLPGISGLDVCQKMRARKNHTPVLMLTALDATDERIAGLKTGADDYLPKPFDFEELLARIEALYRRVEKYSGHDAEKELSHSGLHFDRTAMMLTVDGNEIELSSKERELISLFLSNERRVLSRERILNAVWNMQEDPMTNVVDVYVGRLRKKLVPYDHLIATVRGAGYRFG
ncbi:response regulator transcription factor [Rhodobacteraceae bacterium B1Z28]|uniref:Response regulator transcription factor n=1 Tax=Ruegeria haliotis TaxID=2747601 RepID=A0ABX2PJ65_9RHOB|nr:response regulator [Ruegeria haliotis]NVO54178.1 response regulator transcription factor [Ruegeria haliotis]